MRRQAPESSFVRSRQVLPIRAVRSPLRPQVDAHSYCSGLFRNGVPQARKVQLTQAGNHLETLRQALEIALPVDVEGEFPQLHDLQRGSSLPGRGHVTMKAVRAEAHRDYVGRRTQKRIRTVSRFVRRYGHRRRSLAMAHEPLHRRARKQRQIARQHEQIAHAFGTGLGNTSLECAGRAGIFRLQDHPAIHGLCKLGDLRAGCDDDGAADALRFANRTNHMSGHRKEERPAVGRRKRGLQSRLGLFGRLQRNNGPGHSIRAALRPGDRRRSARRSPASREQVRRRSAAPCGQRALSRQPVGTSIGLGTSPDSTNGSRLASGSGIGTAAISARVYG